MERRWNRVSFEPFADGNAQLLPFQRSDPEQLADAHKSNFPKPWGHHPDENPLLTPVPAQAGDAIIFTEALTHGSVVNTSFRRRRTVYYCYSIGYMPDWGGQGLHFSERISKQLTDAQNEIVRLK